MECIGCSNCIDACDEIMTKLSRPKGLIRYDSSNGFEGKKRRIIRPRIILYSVLLLIGASVMLFSFSGLSSVSISALRMQGAPYFISETSVRNQYLVRIANKRSVPVHFVIKVSGAQEGLSWSGFENGVKVDGNGEIVRPLVVVVPREEYVGKFTSVLEIRDDSGDVVSNQILKFLGPDPELLKKLK
jgi:polyferredoxin